MESARGRSRSRSRTNGLRRWTALVTTLVTTVVGDWVGNPRSPYALVRKHITWRDVAALSVFTVGGSLRTLIVKGIVRFDFLGGRTSVNNIRALDLNSWLYREDDWGDKHNGNVGFHDYSGPHGNVGFLMTAGFFKRFW